MNLDFTSDWTNSIPPEIARPLCPLWFTVGNSKQCRRRRERKRKRKVGMERLLSLQLRKQHKSPLPSSSLPMPDLLQPLCLEVLSADCKSWLHPNIHCLIGVTRSDPTPPGPQNKDSDKGRGGGLSYVLDHPSPTPPKGYFFSFYTLPGDQWSIANHNTDKDSWLSQLSDQLALQCLKLYWLTDECRSQFLTVSRFCLIRSFFN